MGLIMTKFFVDQSGKYIGGFDGAEPPDGAIEVDMPPSHADFDTWDGSRWLRDADADDREAASDFHREFEIDRIRRLLFEINFDQENRIRTLEGEPTITKAQYKTALLVRVKTL